MKRVVSTPTVLGIAIVLMTGLGMRAEEPKRENPRQFEGNLLLVYLTGRETESGNRAAIQNPRVVQIGGRTFLTGALVNGGDFTKTMFPGRPVWLPLSEIARIVAFDNVDQMKVP